MSGHTNPFTGNLQTGSRFSLSGLNPGIKENPAAHLIAVKLSSHKKQRVLRRPQAGNLNLFQPLHTQPNANVFVSQSMLKTSSGKKAYHHRHFSAICQ